jgi:HlyD family secretion protein
MLKTILSALAILMFCAISIMACSSQPDQSLAPQTTSTVVNVKDNGKIIAEGKVVPMKGAGLGFQVAGTVAEISTAVGDKVDAGQVLVSLDTRPLELQLAQAEGNLSAAQARFDQLKVGARPEDLSAAQQAVKSAQAAYDNLLKPTDNEMIALKADMEKAKAQVNRAQTAYDRIGGDSNPFAGMTLERAALQTAWLDYQRATSMYNNKTQPPDALVQQALANLQLAKSNLAKLTPTREELAQAEANAKAAKAARDLTADTLSRAKLTAPFDGTILAVDLKVGEQVAIGTSVVRIADPNTMQIETTDLTEVNIVNVKEGAPATVTLDAIPGFEMNGKVTSIKGFGENRQGDIVYKVVIALDKQDARLRWNMTTKVNIASQ